MLILTRKEGEKIILGKEIIIAFLGLNKYGGAKIGISAPKSITILREELQIKQELYFLDHYNRQ